MTAANARRGHVFISYKREEKCVAERVKDALESQGFTVWWDERLQCGQQWVTEIDDQLATAGCIVVLWSERSTNSEWVQHEASVAIGRRVYAPCRIDPELKIPDPYGDGHTADLLGWTDDAAPPALRDLIARVDELLPLPPTKIAIARRWVRKRLAAIVLLAFAVAAFLLLQEQARISSGVARQSEEASQNFRIITHDLERMLYRIPEELEIAVEAHFAPGATDVHAYLARLESIDPQHALTVESQPKPLSTELALWELTQEVGMRFLLPFASEEVTEDTRTRILDYGLKVTGSELFPSGDGGLRWHIHLLVTDPDWRESVQSLVELLSHPLELKIGLDLDHSADPARLRSVFETMRLTAITIRAGEHLFVCQRIGASVQRKITEDGHCIFLVSGPWD